MRRSTSIALSMVVAITSSCSHDGAFFEALARDDVEAVRKHLTNGVSVHAVNHEGWSACHVAVEEGALNVLDLLIERGCDVNGRGPSAVTPLMRGSGSGQVEAAKRLIAAGADVNLAGEKDFTALHGAAGGGQAAYARLLVEHGADVGAVAADGMTPLHFAAVPVANGHDVMECLLQNGADPNAKALHGMTPLHLVSKRGTPRNAALLIKHGADPHMKSNGGGPSPLDIARKSGRADLVEVLSK